MDQITLTGVWVPIEIFLDENLTETEKLLLPIIESYSKMGECEANNSALAQVMGTHPTTISKSISHLIELGYLERSGHSSNRVLFLSHDASKKWKALEKMRTFGKLPKEQDPAFGKKPKEEPKSLKDMQTSLPLENAENAGTTLSDLRSPLRGEHNSQSIALKSTFSSRMLAPSAQADLFEEKNPAGLKLRACPEELPPAPVAQPVSYMDRMKAAVEQEKTALSMRGGAASDAGKAPPPPPHIQELILFWNNLGLRKHTDPKTKTYQKVVKDLAKAVHGSLFSNCPDIGAEHKRCFTKDEVMRAMKNFSLAATAPEFLPTKKDHLKKLSISEFLYNPFSQPLNGNGRSAFLKYLAGPPDQVRNMAVANPGEEKNKMVTGKLRDLFVKRCLGGIGRGFDKYTENKFVLASNRTMELFEYLNKKGQFAIPFYNHLTFAETVFEAIMADVGDESKVEVGHLCSDRAFNKVIPAFLFRQGVIKEG